MEGSAPGVSESAKQRDREILENQFQEDTSGMAEDEDLMEDVDVEEPANRSARTSASSQGGQGMKNPDNV